MMVILNKMLGQRAYRWGSFKMIPCGICGHEGSSYEVFGFMPCCKKCFERIMERQKQKELEDKKLEEQTE